MQIKPLNSRLRQYLKKHQLNRKFNKQLKLFQLNPYYPSLHTELLEPKSVGIYSFRIDKKYRSLFIIVKEEVEIIDINDHYK